MAELLDAAREVDGYCRRQGWRHCIIGGMALMRWGEQRMTKDVDLTLLTGFGDEERYINALLADFEPLVSNALDFALRNRVLSVEGGSISDATKAVFLSYPPSPSAVATPGVSA